MAEVSFDTLEGLARRPRASETAASIVSGYVRFTEVNGPFKTEINIYQQGDGDDFAQVDSFITGLVHPIAAEVNWVNTGDVTAVTPTAQLEAVESDSDYRRVRVFDADGLNGAGIIVRVVGF